MKVTLDQKTIQSINLFQTLTGSSIMDCITEDDELYFIVSEGKYGVTVGKNGIKIKNAEKVFRKKIKVFEYAPSVDDFIKNLIPDVQEITHKGKIVYTKVDAKNRPKIIGKGGKNIKIINKFLQRLFDIDELKVR